MPPNDASIPRFGARSKAKELAEEAESLRMEVARLRAELERLGALDAVELGQRRDQLNSEIAAQHARLEAQAREAAAMGQEELRLLVKQRNQVAQRLAELQQEVVVTEEMALLQEVGVYEYRHPLDDAVSYQAELSRLKDAIRTATHRDGGAVRATTSWTVNGSLTEGRKMVRGFSKLLLRAYKAEADNLVRGLKPYKLESAIDRLTKVAVSIAKLGSTMDIAIAEPYHQLRIKELELTADHAERLAEEKEREREEKTRLREERQAQLEFERERAKLEKEQAHYENAMRALLAKNDDVGAAVLREHLDEIAVAIQDVDYRAANVRAGYVYVISNVGAFGEGVVKVGMTRRLDPLDRVRELGDASVPFKFDVHALFFSEDAVGLESQMHQRLESKRVNLVNRRREFFYVTPAEVRDDLAALSGDLLEFQDIPEALEYHQSENERSTSGRVSGLVLR